MRPKLNPDDYDSQVQDNEIHVPSSPPRPGDLNSSLDPGATKSDGNADNDSTTLHFSEPNEQESLRSRVEETQFHASLEPDTQARAAQTQFEDRTDELSYDDEFDDENDDDNLPALPAEAPQLRGQPVLISSVRGNPDVATLTAATITPSVKVFSRDYYQEGPVEPHFKMAPKPKTNTNYARTPPPNVAKPDILKQQNVEALAGNG